MSRGGNDWSSMIQDTQRGGFRGSQPPMNYGAGGGYNDLGLSKGPVGGPGAIGFPSNRGPAQGPGPLPVNGGRTNALSGSKDTVFSVRLEGIPQEPKMDFLDHVIKTFKLRVTNAALKQNRQTNLYYAILNCDHEDAVRTCYQMLNNRSIQFGNSSYTTTVVLPDSLQSTSPPQPTPPAGPGPQGPRGQQFSGMPNGQSSRFNGGAGGPPGGPRGGGFSGSQSARPFVQQAFQGTTAPRGRAGPGYSYGNQDARNLFDAEEQSYQQPQPQQQQSQLQPLQQWGQGAGAGAGTGGPGFRRAPGGGGGGGRFGEFESVQRPANTYDRFPEPSGGRGFRGGGGGGGPPHQQWGGGGGQLRGAARDDSFVDTRRRNLSSGGGANGFNVEGGEIGPRGGGRAGGRGGRGPRDFQQQQPYDQSGEQHQQGGQRQDERKRGPSESAGARQTQSFRARGGSGSGFEQPQNEAGGSGRGRPGARRRPGPPSLPVKPAGALAPTTQRAPRPPGAGRQQQQPQLQDLGSGGNEVEAKQGPRSPGRRRNKRRSALDDQTAQADETVGELKSEDRKPEGAEPSGRRRRARGERSSTGAGEDQQGSGVQKQEASGAGSSGRRDGRRARGERDPQAQADQRGAGGGVARSRGFSGRQGRSRHDGGGFSYAYRRAMGGERRSRSFQDPSSPKPGEFYLYLSEVPLPALPVQEPGKEHSAEETKSAANAANAALLEELKAWMSAHGVTCKELRQYWRHSIFFVMFESAEQASEAFAKLKADLSFKEKTLKLEEGKLMASPEERRKKWLERETERDRQRKESQEHPYIIFWRVFATVNSFEARREVLKQLFESKGIVFREIVRGPHFSKINVTFETVEQAREAFAKLRDEKTPGRDKPINMELARRFANEQDLENNRLVRERANPGFSQRMPADALNKDSPDEKLTEEQRAAAAEKRRAQRQEQRQLENAEFVKEREKRDALKGAYLLVRGEPFTYYFSYETDRRQQAEKKLQELREKVEAALREEHKTGEQSGDASAPAPPSSGITELWGFCRKSIAVIAFESLERATAAHALLSAKKLSIEGLSHLHFSLGSDFESKRASGEGEGADGTLNGSKSKVTRIPRRRHGGGGRYRVGPRNATSGNETDAAATSQQSAPATTTSSGNAGTEATESGSKLEAPSSAPAN